jgi:hypothetical protein
MKNNSIFVKYTDIPNDNIKNNKSISEDYKIEKKNILKSIPNNSYNTEQLQLKKTMREYRWKIYKINNKEFIEISYIDPNMKRIYVNKNKEWVEHNEITTYEQYLIKQYYHYTKIDS